jgi:hypothetical protein
MALKSGVESMTSSEISKFCKHYPKYCINCFAKTDNVVWIHMTPFIEHTGVCGLSTCPKCEERVSRIVDAWYGMVFPKTPKTYYFQITNSTFYVNVLYRWKDEYIFGFCQFLEDDVRCIRFSIKQLHEKQIKLNEKYDIRNILKDLRDGLFEYLEKNGIDKDEYFVY